MTNIYDFHINRSKKDIEHKLLKKLLELYDISIEEVETPLEKRKFYVNQKRYRVSYKPKEQIVNIKLLTAENSFILEDGWK